eukprot:scaffold67721_cov15-Tisochrysis_lutea.AAC.1
MAAAAAAAAAAGRGRGRLTPPHPARPPPNAAPPPGIQGGALMGKSSQGVCLVGSKVLSAAAKAARAKEQEKKSTLATCQSTCCPPRVYCRARL